MRIVGAGLPRPYSVYKLFSPPRLPIRNGTVRQPRQSRAVSVDDVEFVVAVAG